MDRLFLPARPSRKSAAVRRQYGYVVEQEPVIGRAPGLSLCKANAGEIDGFISKNGYPAVILLNDQGTITARVQTLHQLKSNTSYSHIPVVVLGERSSPDYVKECYRAGASTFITKPSSINATHKKIALFFSYWFEVAEV